MPKKTFKKDKTKKNKIKKSSLRNKTIKGGVFRKTFRDLDNPLNESELKRYFPEITDFLIGNEVDDPSKQIFFKLGEHVVKDYYQIQLLGKGSYGSVVSARRIDFPREKYVVKISKITEKNKIIVFMNEIHFLKYLKKLCNEFVVCYVDLFIQEVDNKPDKGFLVLENLVDYITLDEYINKPQLKKILDNYFIEKSKSPVIRIFNNLLEGLFYLHKNHVVHRDIKPGNLMIHPLTFNIKYIDFGLSCFTAVTQRTNGMLTPFCIRKSGTPNTFDPNLYNFYYNVLPSQRFIKSPQKIKNEIIKIFMEQSDLWSVGIVMIYILCQKSPTSYFKSNIEDFTLKTYIEKLTPKEKENITDKSLFNLYPFYKSNQLLTNPIMKKPIDISNDIVKTVSEINKVETNGYFSSSLESLLSLAALSRHINTPEEQFL